MDRDAKILQDRVLVQDIASGSVDSWHRFVEQYSPLLLSVIRRYLNDEDDARNAWADLLVRLRNGLLDRYEGRARLSTWLVFVAQTAAVDQIRKCKGRRKIPPGLKNLEPRDRFVFQELFQRGKPPAEVRHALATRKDLQGEDEFEEILDRLEALVGDRALKRLAWDLHAQTVGHASGRLLEYIDHVAAEAAQRQEELSPERQLLQRRARSTIAEVQKVLRSMPESERTILELKFAQGWSAPRIQATLSLGSRREVYTRVHRALRHLRRKLGLAEYFAFVLTFFW